MLDKINTGLDKLRKRNQELLDVTTQMLNRAIAPIDGARRAAATLFNMAGDALVMVRTFESNVGFSLRSVNATANFTVGLSLQAANTTRKAIQILKRVRINALTQQANLMMEAEGNILSTVIGRDGTDLRKVAQKATGSAADWRVLAVFNNVRTARVAAGQEIHIPRPNIAR